MSPKDNRERPPLRYEAVYRLKERFPSLHLELNGGVKSLTEVRTHLKKVDGVMIGRAAYHNPYILAGAERDIFGHSDFEVPSRDRLVDEIMPYAERLVAGGERIARLTRHMLGLYHGTSGARLWRQVLSTDAASPGADASILLKALKRMHEARAEAEARACLRSVTQEQREAPCSSEDVR